MPQGFNVIPEEQVRGMQNNEYGEDDLLTPLKHGDMQEQQYVFNKSGQ